MAAAAAAGQLSLKSANVADIVPGGAGGKVIVRRYREVAVIAVAGVPSELKYRVCAVPKVIPNCAEVVLVFGVARRSAMTLLIILVAAVCDNEF